MVLGIVALCQPWNLVPAPLRRDHHPRSGWSASWSPLVRSKIAPEDADADEGAQGMMTQIELRGVEKFFGAVQVIKDLNLTDRRQRVHRAARPVRLRQDHDAARHRRAGNHRRGRHPHRRQAGAAPEGVGPRHRLRVPVLLALSAYERLREHRLPAAATRKSSSEVDSEVRERRRDAAHHPSARPNGRRRCRAATCSASRSAGRWCGGPRRC